MITKIVAFLARTWLVRKHALKIKVLLMFYPFLVVLFLSHWLAAFAAFGAHVFLASMTIKVIENQTGISVYAERIFDLDGLRRLDVVKMLVMILVGLPCIVFFSSIDPMRIIFISGFR